MNVAVAFDTNALSVKEEALLEAAGNMDRPLRIWGVEEGREMEADWGRMTYEKLYAGPRVYRGTTIWDAAPKQYTRITAAQHGVEPDVPPWGGVKRIAAGVRQVGSYIRTGRAIYGRHARVTGTVKAKKRPSGKRVSRSSVMMADTNEIRRQMTRNLVLDASRKAISLVTTVAYAVYLNARRKFAALGSHSGRRLREHCQRHLDQVVRGINRK